MPVLLAHSLVHFVPVQSVDFSPCLLVSSCNNILMLPECLLQTPASVILLLEVNLLLVGPLNSIVNDQTFYCILDI